MQKKKYWLGSEEPGSQDTFFVEALDQNLWEKGTKSEWDACWITDMPDRGFFNQLDENKTINHIPGNNALTIKSKLYDTLNKAKLAVSGLPQEQRYDFFPKTFSMPAEYFDFQEAAAQQTQNKWILKPQNMSRGRGIEMVQHPETVPLETSWIVQQYLDKPHLWNGYKYVLRCYVLITSTDPLRFYWFHEGSAKLTSEKYDPEDLDNPYRHLTNPDINEHNDAVDTPVTFHSFKVYKQWLRSQGIDDQKLFNDIQDMIALTVIAAREPMLDQQENIEANLQGSYELIGLDCMIDDQYKPWILECNLSPSLEICSTDPDQANEETLTKQGMVSEIVEMLGMNNPNHAQLCEKTRIQHEIDQSKGFQCIFPSMQANDYLHCFPVPRYSDINSLPTQFTLDHSKFSFNSSSETEAVFENSLALFASSSTNNQTAFITPNELASWIWIQIAANKQPDQIAAELRENFGGPSENAAGNEELSWEAQIWKLLADWSKANLFNTQENTQSESLTKATQAEQHNTKQWIPIGFFNMAGTSIELRSTCKIAADYLKNFTEKESLFSKKASSNDIYNVDIFRSNYGYVAISDTDVISGSRKLSRLVDDLVQICAKQSLGNDDIALLQAIVISDLKRNLVLIGNKAQLDALAYEICIQHDNIHIVSGAAILAEQANIIKCTDFPLLLPSNALSDGSAYDAKNYYPQKPRQHRNHSVDSSESRDHPNNPLVKKEWFISETYDQPCWLSPANGHYSEKAQIKDIIFINNSEDTKQCELNILNSAEGLSKLWKHCSQKSTHAHVQIVDWIRGIQMSEFHCRDLNHAKSSLQLITKLFS